MKIIKLTIMKRMKYTQSIDVDIIGSVGTRDTPNQPQGLVISIYAIR